MSKTYSSNYANIVLTDAGYNPVSITSAASISGTAAAIAGSAPTAWTITNSGIVNGGTTIGGVGIRLEAGGTVTNQSTGRISGGRYGIDVAGGAGTVVNAGTITAADPTGLNKGVKLGAGGSLTNQATGTIAARAGIYVYTSPGTIINAGRISASSGPGIALNAGGSLTNQATGTIQSDDLPVYIGGGGTVFNAGSILFTGYSGFSLRFGAGFTNRLIVTPEAVFNWPVDGGNTIGATAVSTLELASSAGTGTATGLLFTNFAAVEVDAGAAWTIASVLATGVTLTNDGTLTGRVALQPGVVVNNNGLIQESLYDAIYAGNSSAPITVTNTGTLVQSGSAAGIQALGGGSVSNSGTLVGGSRAIDLGSSGTVTNSGTIGATFAGSGGVILRAGGSLSNAATGTISATGFGIYLSGGGSIINNGSINGSGNAGVAMDGGGTLTNTKGATITGHYEAVQANKVAATVINNGSILDTDGSGVVLSVGGSVTNQADGIIAGQDTGVGFSSGTGTVVNQGSIGGTNNNGVGMFGGGLVTNAAGGIITGYGGVQIDGGAGTVTNAGSIGATGANALRLAAGFTNLLAVAPGASFTGTVTGGNLIGSGTVSTLELLSGASTGVLSGLGAQFVNFAQITVDAGASWSLTGSNTIAAGVTLTELSGAVVTDTGTLANNGLIVLDPSTLTVGGLTGTGVVTVDTGSTLTVQGLVAGGETITFGTAGGRLDLDAPGSVAGAVTSFEIGDVIDLKGVDPNSVSYGGGTLAFAGGSFALSLAAPGEIGVTASADGAAISVLCFCVNTLIRTPGGQMPVQDLAVGDEVMTERGVARRIVWIGTGRVLATRGRRNAATPVIVRKGALADNVPTRDLRLTKGHALFLDGALIPVEFLVNHRSIEWDDLAQEVELFHIELETHDVLIANGAPAESYRDDGNRWLFRNANAHWDAPPQPPCAPVLTGGRRVDALWRRLLDRAGSRPRVPLEADPDLHLLVDGARVDASARNGKAHVFTLATRPDAIRIVSRAAAPDELGVARDPRLLGVALSRIALRQGTRFRLVEPQDPLLAEGFHAFEPDAALRWTDGDAALPMALLDGLEAPFELVLHVACTSLYPPQPALRLVA